MTPAAIIRQAAADGVRLALSPAGTIRATGDGAAVNRWLPVIREHKPSILAALQEATNDALHDPAMDARRQRVLAMLDAHPDSRYSILADNLDTDPVLVTVAIRDVATFDLVIPSARFDAFGLLGLLDRHGGATVH